MLKYNIAQGKGGRVIVVQADDLMRYAIHDIHDNPIQFKRVGSQAIAILHTDAKIYRKPSGHELHTEYIKHNARSLWLGFTPKFDNLVRNLYEYDQTI